MPETENKSVQNFLTRFLRPERFDVEPNTSVADIKWLHWRDTFENFLAEEAVAATDSMKLKLLVNHLSPTIYNYVRACANYTDAIKTLDDVFIKPKNEILARWHLTTRKQRSDESIAEYIRALKLLAHECRFKAVSADEHQSEYIREAFIDKISFNKIRESWKNIK